MMEEILWRIDVKPNESSKLEDGEISESDNESSLRNGGKLAKPSTVPDSTAVLTSSANDEGCGDPSSSGHPIDSSLPIGSGQPICSGHLVGIGQSNSVNSNDQSDLSEPANKSNANKPIKKKSLKKKPNPIALNYAKLSEEELQKQFMLVHKKLESMESNSLQPQLNNASQPVDSLASLLGSSPDSFPDALPGSLSISTPVPVNQSMNLPGDQSNAHPLFGQQQASHQQFPKKHSNANQPFVFQPPTNRPPQFNNNMKPTKKFKPPSQQQLFNFVNSNPSVNDVKKLLFQISKIIMSKSFEQKSNQHNNKFNKNANQRKFPGLNQADAGNAAGPNQSNANLNSNQQQNPFVGYKRKLMDKNNNPMKRPNNNKNFNNPINPNNPNNNSKKHPVFTSTYNQSATAGSQQPSFASPFSPVITSDIFGGPNQFKHNQNFNKNPNRHRPQKQQVCKYFLLGSCHKGDHCEFRHTKDKNTKINELCKFYVQNACDKGVNCPYLHKEFPCKYFHTDTVCHDGANCKFSHEPLTDEKKKVLRQFLNPKDKTEPYKRDKVLLGDPTSNMKCSLETWKWQQEIRKLSAEQTGEEENVFKIANEFIIKEVPDLKFNKSVYSEGFRQLCEIKKKFKKESFDANEEKRSLTPIPSSGGDFGDSPTEEDDPFQQSSPVNNLIQQSNDSHRNSLYQRRSDLLKNKENEADLQQQESAYLKKVELILSGNKMNKMHKEEAGNPLNSPVTRPATARPATARPATARPATARPVNASIQPDRPTYGGSSSTNASLYKCKELDNFVLNSLSGLINKLADETKIDSASKESAFMNFEDFKRSFTPEKKPLIARAASSPVVPSIVKENDASSTKARSLIDEIMGSEGYVATPNIGLASLGRPTSQSLQPTTGLSPLAQPCPADSHLGSSNTLKPAGNPNETGDLNSICFSGLKEFSANSLQTAKESDLFNFTNQHLNKQPSLFGPDYDLPLPTGGDQRGALSGFLLSDAGARERGYILSKSDDGGTEFKLHFVEKSEVTYYEYEPYLNGSPIAATDPRMDKIFRSPKPSILSGYSMPLSEYLNRPPLHQPGDGLTLLSTLSDLREKKLI